MPTRTLNRVVNNRNVNGRGQEGESSNRKSDDTQVTNRMMHDKRTMTLLVFQESRVQVRLVSWFDCCTLLELVPLRKLPKRERFVNSG